MTTKATENDTPTVSLLWPPGVDEAASRGHGKWNAQALTDLGLDQIASFFSSDRTYTQRIREILYDLCQEPQVIHYRQDIIENLLLSPGLVAGLAEIQPLIANLSAYRTYGPGRRVIQIEQLIWRLGQLELYVDCIQELVTLLTRPGLKLEAVGLRRLQELVTGVAEKPTFQNLAAELPALITQMRQASSVTIGVNLDTRLRPEAATLLSVNDQKFKGESLLNRLFGDWLEGDEFQGITPLYTKAGQGGGIQMRDLLKDLDRLLVGTTRSVSSALGRYTRIHTNFLAPLAFEFAFYLGAVNLIQTMQKRGLPMCRPEAALPDLRLGMITDLYELNMALQLCQKETTPDLKSVLVTNDVTFDDQGRIFILTGPNQGGKTTYTQAIGLIQTLFQAGLYVPGSQARLSPVDGIFTHFPVEEKPGLEAGRFGEEAKRLNDIFHQATRHSLILMNESLSSTSEGESLYLAQDIVRALKMLGVRAVFATHLHALAEKVEAINNDTEGDSRLISMVAGMAGLDETGADDGPRTRRTYKIEPGPPMGVSYARDIASRYGISLEKILQTLQERKVIMKGKGRWNA